MATISSPNINRLNNWVHSSVSGWTPINESQSFGVEKVALLTAIDTDSNITIPFGYDSINTLLMSNAYISGNHLIHFLTLCNQPITVNTPTEFYRALHRIGRASYNYFYGGSRRQQFDVIKIIHGEKYVYCSKGCIFDDCMSLLFGFFSTFNLSDTSKHQLVMYVNTRCISYKGWFYSRIREIWAQYVSTYYRDEEVKTYMFHNNNAGATPILSPLSVLPRFCKKDKKGNVLYTPIEDLMQNNEDIITLEI